MGFLSDGGGSGSDGGVETVSSEAPVTESTAPETAAPESADPSVTAEPQRTERVAVGRRSKAAAATNALETQFKALSDTLTRQGQETAQAIALRDQELARLRGGFEAIQPFIQQRQPAGPPPASPQDMMREAKKLLDANDFDGYQAKYAEAIRADILARMPPPQAPQQQQHQPNPIVAGMLNQFPAVINAGERGIQLAVIKDQELAVMGFPNNYDRYRKALELASNQLAPNAPAQYSQDSRQVLSGTPPARGAGGGSRGEGVTLNEMELKWAEASGMSKEEYAKYLVESDPKRLER